MSWIRNTGKEAKQKRGKMKEYIINENVREVRRKIPKTGREKIKNKQFVGVL
jgi:hypothetical protein